MTIVNFDRVLNFTFSGSGVLPFRMSAHRYRGEEERKNVADCKSYMHVALNKGDVHVRLALD